MAPLVKDSRGAVSLQVALMLPILIIVLIGGFELWKVSYTQQILNDAAYQATRLLSTQANWEDVPWQAEQLVRRYVAQSPFVDPALRADPDNDEVLHVGIEYYPPVCGAPVSVRVELLWTIGRELGARRGNPWLPFLGRQAILRGEAEGVVLCERIEDVEQP